MTRQGAQAARLSIIPLPPPPYVPGPIALTGTAAASSKSPTAALTVSSSGGPGVPALLATVTNGVPAADMWGYGSFSLAITNQGTLDNWRTTYGFTGMKGTLSGSFFLPSNATLESAPQYFYFPGSDVTAVADPLHATTNSKFDWFQAYMGYGAPSVNGGTYGTVVNPPVGGPLGPKRYKETLYPNYRWWLGWNLRYNNNVEYPPMGDWWNDTIWTGLARIFSNFAAGLKFMGADGFLFDCETSEIFNVLDHIPFSKPTIFITSTNRPAASSTNIKAGCVIVESDTGNYLRSNGTTWVATTLAAAQAQVQARGYQIGQAIFAAYPNCSIVVYEWRVAGGPYDSVNHDSSYPRPQTQQDSFMFGIMQAMQEANSSGYFWEWDAEYYRSTFNLVTNTQRGLPGAMALLSSRLPATVRDYMMSKFAIIPTSFAGTDGSADLSPVVPEPTYSNELAFLRQYSMDGWRSEYLLHMVNGNPGPVTFGSPAQSLYLDNRTNPPGGHGPGMIAAMSTVTQDTTSIVVGAIGQSRAGSTVTLTFTAAHATHGIRRAHWTLYAANGTSIAGQGESVMNWNPNGGTQATNFNAAFQDCTATVANGTAGLYVNVDVYSVIGQRTSRQVHLT